MVPRPQATTHSTSGKRKRISWVIAHTGSAVVRSACTSSPSVRAKRAASAVRQRRFNSGGARRGAGCGRGGGAGGGGRGRGAAGGGGEKDGKGGGGGEGGALGWAGTLKKKNDI